MLFFPSKRLLKIIALLGLIAFAIAVARVFISSSNTMGALLDWLSLAWFLALAFLLAAGVVDSLRRQHVRQLVGKRVLPGSLALNRPCAVKFRIDNPSSSDIHLQFIDILSLKLRSNAFPVDVHIRPEQSVMIDYSMTPEERGDACCQPAQVLVQSRFNLWVFKSYLAETDTVKVYPDFSLVNAVSLLSVEKNMNYLGEHLSRKRGDGLEFHQLRDFSVGDTLSQIDWKATARLDRPISREFQEEKDQNIIFLLDSSRRMRPREGKMSYFDYALNALLINAYIALDKGDAVGVMTFAGDYKWLSPIKGKPSISRLLNHLYTAQTSTSASDYIDAAQSLLNEHRKRSLIILITNIYEEDTDDIILAANLLAKHHLVMIVALQENLLEEGRNREVVDTSSALLYSGLSLMAQQRQATLDELRKKNVIVVDAQYHNLHIKLLHEYLQLKRTGRI